MSPNRAQYEAYGRDGYVQVIFVEESEGFLVIHPKHGRNEWVENLTIGRVLVEGGESIVLLPNTDGRPSPDALRNGEEWEFKTIHSEQVGRALQYALRRGKTQSPNVLCLILHSEVKAYELTLGIYRAVKFDFRQQLQRIDILFPNGKLIGMTRNEVHASSFIQKFNS